MLLCKTQIQNKTWCALSSQHLAGVCPTVTMRMLARMLSDFCLHAYIQTTHTYKQSAGQVIFKMRSLHGVLTSAVPAVRRKRSRSCHTAAAYSWEAAAAWPKVTACCAVALWSPRSALLMSSKVAHAPSRLHARHLKLPSRLQRLVHAVVHRL